MKIFISVGTHAQQFNRLLKEMDLLLEEGRIKDDVFAQTGNSDYRPEAFDYKEFLSPKEFAEKIENADLVVSHGGAGTIINALMKKKKLIIVPRLEKFKEHTNDHQVELAEAFEKRGKAIAVMEISKLGDAFEKAKKFKPNFDSDRENLIGYLKGFLEGIK